MVCCCPATSRASWPQTSCAACWPTASTFTLASQSNRASKTSSSTWCATDAPPSCRCLLMQLHEVRVLLGKELRQIRRSRAALASSTLLPLLLITVAPMGQLLAMRSVPPEPADIPSGALPPGLADAVQDPTLFFVRFMLPMFMCLGGLIVPSVAATYTIVAERE